MFFWKKDEPISTKMKLIVTGVAKESDLIKLAEACEKKGQRTVVTALPVLGVYEI